MTPLEEARVRLTAWSNRTNATAWETYDHGPGDPLGSDLRLLLDALNRTEAERDAARDLAFRAAFAEEEGSEVEWGVRWATGHVSRTNDEADSLRWRSRTHRPPDAVVRRVVGPWKPVS